MERCDDAAAIAAQLAEGLAAQCAGYRVLEQLCERQRVLVSSDQTDALIGLLQERERLIVELTRLSRESEPLRQRWPAIRDQVDEATRARIAAFLQEIFSRLEAIARADQRDSGLLDARRLTATVELAQTTGRRRANTAYAAQIRSAAGPQVADMTG